MVGIDRKCVRVLCKFDTNAIMWLNDVVIPGVIENGGALRWMSVLFLRVLSYSKIVDKMRRVYRVWTSWNNIDIVWARHHTHASCLHDGGVICYC